MWNNHLDFAIIHWMNHFASGSAHFNQFVNYVATASLFKGLPMMAMIWFFWFKSADGKSDFRRTILAALFGCFAALVLARVLNNVVPFQPRPFANEVLGLRPLAGLSAPDEDALYHWSSFPSDHAALFFGLAAGIFAISRPIGSVVMLYVLMLIALPRIYLGLHYPTDIMAGAFIGIGSVGLCAHHRFRKSFIEPCMRLLERYPAAFQAGLFVVTFELARMFEDFRPLIRVLLKLSL